MNKTILFYGALGHKSERKIGGGEAGNMKTIDIIESAGMEVERLYKPYPGLSVLSKLVYIFALYFTVIKLIYRLIVGTTISIVHISGFYKHLIYQEFLLIYIANLFGKKCIYELRAGGVKESYSVGSKFYQYFFKKAVSSADVILVQGERYVELLNSLGAKKTVHYPNYIVGEVIPRTTKCLDCKDVMKMVYFGRMSKTKNILFMLDICKELKKKEISYEFELIGEGDIKYIEQIKEQIRTDELYDNVLLSPAAFGASLVEKLKDKHFFIFPTQEPREGHSNSLTEAMSLGIVPICSDYGFNREIVNSKELVVIDFDAKSYAELIEKFYKQNRWINYSRKMQEIVRTKFTDSIVKSSLLAVYQ